MSLFGAGIVYLTCDQKSFGVSYTQLFEWASPKVWGVLSVSAAILGYVGLFLRKKRLWMIAHCFATFLFTAMSVLFGLQYFTAGIGGPTGLTTYSALAANAWVRFTGLYNADPFRKISEYRN